MWKSEPENTIMSDCSEPHRYDFIFVAASLFKLIWVLSIFSTIALTACRKYQLASKSYAMLVSIFLFTRIAEFIVKSPSPSYESINWADLSESLAIAAQDYHIYLWRIIWILLTLLGVLHRVQKNYERSCLWFMSSFIMIIIAVISNTIE